MEIMLIKCMLLVADVVIEIDTFRKSAGYENCLSNFNVFSPYVKADLFKAHQAILGGPRCLGKSNERVRMIGVTV